MPGRDHRAGAGPLLDVEAAARGACGELPRRQPGHDVMGAAGRAGHPCARARPPV